MPKIKIVSRKTILCVRLNEEDREELNQYLRCGKSSARSLTRARIFHQVDKGRSDDGIVEALRVSKTTSNRIRKRYCEGGLEFALHEKPRQWNASNFGSCMSFIELVP